MLPSADPLHEFDSIVNAWADYLRSNLREGDALEIPIMASLLLGMRLQQALPCWSESARDALARAAAEMGVVEHPRLAALALVETLGRYIQVTGREAG